MITLCCHVISGAYHDSHSVIHRSSRRKCHSEWRRDSVVLSCCIIKSKQSLLKTRHLTLEFRYYEAKPNPRHLAWAASALPLSCNNWTTTSPHNPLYVLQRWYWIPQSHTWQPLSTCRQYVASGQPLTEYESFQSILYLFPFQQTMKYRDDVFCWESEE